MAKLGQDFDVLHQIVPVDLATANNTGARIHMKSYSGVCFIGYLATGTAAEAVTFDVKEHNASTGGTSQDLDVVARYYTKTEATLDGDEQWVEVTQTAASEVTNAVWDDANQLMVAIEVEAVQLSDDFEWLSVDVDDPGTAHIGCVFAIAYGLHEQRAPDSLVEPNA